MARTAERQNIRKAHRRGELAAQQGLEREAPVRWDTELQEAFYEGFDNAILDEDALALRAENDAERKELQTMEEKLGRRAA